MTLFSEWCIKVLEWMVGRYRTLYKLNMEIVLVTDQTVYMLDKFQRLNCTRLKGIIVPFSTDALTKTISNKDYASQLAVGNAYLTLVSTDSKNLVWDEPLLDYVLDDQYKLNKHLFDLTNVDWTQSYIKYPSTALPNANNGKALQIIIEFEDMPDSGKN